MTGQSTPKCAILWVAVSSKQQATDDKESLAIQEAQQRAVATANGWRVIDVLKVPGHSRTYLDFYEMAADAKEVGIDAFYRLQAHWKARDFDVCLVWDGDRFAREQAPHAFIVSSIIDSGAKIYSLKDGWIDAQNYRMFIAMSGYKAASEVDALVKKSQATKDAKALKGKLINSRPVWSHKQVRDDTWQFVALVPDVSKQPVIIAAAQLLLKGIGWKKIELALYERGFHQDGKPYHHQFTYFLFNNPGFWGHTARHWNRQGVPVRRTPWIFDDAYPPPEGVLLVRDTHEPALPVELREPVKAEMLRRFGDIKGHNFPAESHRFSHLLLCRQCGYHMIYYAPQLLYRCKSKYSRYEGGCDPSPRIPEQTIVEWLDARLRQMLNESNPLLFTQRQAGVAESISSTETAIQTAERQIARLIERQSRADDTLADHYERQLAKLADELKIHRAALAGLRTKRAQEDSTGIVSAYAVLREHGVDWLWSQEERVINQFLHSIMPRRRLVVAHQRIVGLGDAP